MVVDKLIELIKRACFSDLEEIIENADDKMKQVYFNRAIDNCLKYGYIDKAKEFIDKILYTDILLLEQRPKAIAGVIGALIDAKDKDYVDELLENGIENLDVLETDETKHIILLELAAIFEEKGLRELSIKYCKKYVYRMIQMEKNVFPKDGCFYMFKPISEYTFLDLINNSITLSSPYNFNDPIDSLIYEAFDIATKNGKTDFGNVFETEMRKIRIKCFAMSDEKGTPPVYNTLMWAHYADSHRGICVKYKFPIHIFEDSENFVGRFGIVSYPNESIDVKKDSYDFRECFLTKQSEWHYENEIRFIAIDTNRSEQFLSLDLKCPNCIETIYFGRKCSPQMIEAVKRIFEGKNVSFYRMHFNPNDIFKLCDVEIE